MSGGRDSPVLQKLGRFIFSTISSDTTEPFLIFLGKHLDQPMCYVPPFRFIITMSVEPNERNQKQNDVFKRGSSRMFTQRSKHSAGSELSFMHRVNELTAGWRHILGGGYFNFRENQFPMTPPTFVVIEKWKAIEWNGGGYEFSFNMALWFIELWLIEPNKIYWGGDTVTDCGLEKVLVNLHLKPQLTAFPLVYTGTPSQRFSWICTFLRPHFPISVSPR